MAAATALSSLRAPSSFSVCPAPLSVAVRTLPMANHKHNLVHARGIRLRASYSVKLVTPHDEGDVSFEVDGSTSILDAAEEAGVADLRYLCRAGACSMCAAKIISGTVDQSDGIFLDNDKIAAGYVLTCVAYPTSDLIIQANEEEGIPR